MWNQSYPREYSTESLARGIRHCHNRAMTNTGRPPQPRPVHLDDVSKAIIEQLQADGRRSYADIGKAVGLSEAAVRQRVQRLTESGVMQIVAVTDPMQLGFTRQAMIGIRAGGDTRVLAERIAEIPEIDYVVLTAGSFDVLAEVVCENDEELITLLNSRIRNLDGVQSTETFVYLKLQKQFYNWGTR
jgi:Lrp/AsnC family transcriptional regulator, regulator for asnA, asnC and gidA